MNPKKSRGRPAGSEINDDRFLNEISDLLYRNPAMKPTSAMRRVISANQGLWVASSEAAMLRRLQEK